MCGLIGISPKGPRNKDLRSLFITRETGRQTQWGTQFIMVSERDGERQIGLILFIVLSNLWTCIFCIICTHLALPFRMAFSIGKERHWTLA
jgi:hypothetical protein